MLSYCFCHGLLLRWCNMRNGSALECLLLYISLASLFHHNIFWEDGESNVIIYIRVNVVTQKVNIFFFNFVLKTVLYNLLIVYSCKAIMYSLPWELDFYHWYRCNQILLAIYRTRIRATAFFTLVWLKEEVGQDLA